jgi:hypothetical protein
MFYWVNVTTRFASFTATSSLSPGSVPGDIFNFTGRIQSPTLSSGYQGLVVGDLDFGPSTLVKNSHGGRGDIALAVTETSREYGDPHSTHRNQQTATFLVGADSDGLQRLSSGRRTVGERWGSVVRPYA